MNETVNHLIAGFMVTAYSLAGLFFAKFWRSSRDRLFLIFASAFWLLGIQRLILAFNAELDEKNTLLYFVRMIAFALIILAIVDKNRARKT